MRYNLLEFSLQSTSTPLHILSATYRLDDSNISSNFASLDNNIDKSSESVRQKLLYACPIYYNSYTHEDEFVLEYTFCPSLGRFIYTLPNLIVSGTPKDSTISNMLSDIGLKIFDCATQYINCPIIPKLSNFEIMLVTCNVEAITPNHSDIYCPKYYRLPKSEWEIFRTKHTSDLDALTLAILDNMTK